MNTDKNSEFYLCSSAFICGYSFRGSHLNPQRPARLLPRRIDQRRPRRPLSYHAQHLPKDVRWYADKSGAAEIAELACGGFAVSAGENALRLGITAVAARLENGTLKVLAGACPNLLREASLYRYSENPTDRRSETPVDAHNHALAALRYMVCMIDAHQMARMKGKGGAGEP